MTYTEINGKTINDKGEVAVAYYTTVPHVVRVGSIDYAFTVARNVCAAWVKPEHVDSILQLKRRCCGNNYSPTYRLQNYGNTRRWTGDGER